MFHRGDAKAGRLEPNETVITKSPPLTREGVVALLQQGQSLVPEMFGETPDENMLSFRISPPPLRLDPGGVVRIGNSRISLDQIIEHYEDGMTPEEMVRAHDTLVLADVYSVVAYYLRNHDEALAYLTRRGGEAAELRAKIEANRPRITREDLLARRSARKKNHAPTGK